RPQCGTCRKSKRECKYELSASSKRGRPRNEVEMLQEQIEDIQNIQYHQLNQMGSLLKMAVLPDAQETMPMASDNNAVGDYLMSNNPTDEAYGWNNFYSPLISDENPPPSLNLDLSGDTLTFFTEFKPDQSDLPIQDPLDQLAAKFKSSLYVGPSSLVTLNDDGEEQLIPQDDFSDLSLVEDQLKVLPIPGIAESLIDVYYQVIETFIFHGFGLHRKVKSDQISDEVKEMQDMAFWGFFASETWVSACYGRPSAIDESTCDVDLLSIPPDSNPDEETRLHIAWVLHINLLRIFAQVRKYLHGWAKIAGSSREENQFRFLDGTLGKWFYTLPHWLKFEEMAQDPKGSFLGEMHTLFWTVLILLHSRNLTMFTSDHSLDDSNLASQTICVHAAIILLHCLDVLMNTVPNFYEQTCTALFSFAPAIRVLTWTAKRGDSKAELMVQRLNEIKKEVAEIARRRFVDQTTGEGRLDGEEKLKGSLNVFKAYEEQATFDSEKQKDNSYKKYRKSPNLPSWVDAGIWLKLKL
ncbi:416_t:CDS:2, partial [Racocetra fulgida]